MDEAPSPSRWKILAIVSVAELLAISCWMISSAVSPELAEQWNLDDSQAALLTTAVQLGFVAGTLLAAIFNLADILSSRWYFSVSAVAAALANLALLVCENFWTAAAARFLVGLFLAGVYPPAMKMIATWFREQRGFAIGTLIGAMVIGKAFPFLLKTLQIQHWQTIVVVSSIAASMGGALILGLYREGPHTFERRAFSLRLVGEVIADRKTRLAIGGYLGHMWELYAMWACIQSFLYVAALRAGLTNETVVPAVTFLVISAGALGCILGGRWADLYGRERFVNWAMLISGICCLLIGLALGIGFWCCTLVALIWGFFVVADSAQFSTLVTEDCPRHAVGTALTLQTSLGFLLTTATIQLVPALESTWGWEYAFAVLAIGPMLGIISIFRLKKIRNQS